MNKHYGMYADNIYDPKRPAFYYRHDPAWLADLTGGYKSLGLTLLTEGIGLERSDAFATEYDVSAKALRAIKARIAKELKAKQRKTLALAA